MDRFDVVVVGGGPAGLHAALKAAVLNQSVLVVDRGPETARVWQAPAIANVPGMPGISGPDLLQRLRRDLDSFAKLAGKQLVEVAEKSEAVEARRESEGGFRIRIRPTGNSPSDGDGGSDAGGADREIHARVVILATGLVDRKPGVPEAWRGGSLSPFVHRGEVGYCVLCEGWGLDGRDVVVLGRGSDAGQVAKDLSHHFGARVTLCEVERSALADRQLDLAALEAAGVRVEAREVKRLRDAGDNNVVVEFDDDTEQTFDKAILAYGFHKVNSDLAAQLGAKITDEGYVLTDDDCEALDAEGHPIRGLFAVGDVRENRWKQVVIGFGEAERAAITAYAYRLPDPPASPFA